MATVKKEFAVVKKLLESDKSVKTGYDLWLFAFVMYKYNNWLNDIKKSIYTKEDPSDERKSNLKYKELIDNVVTAHNLAKVGLNDEIVL